MAFVKRWDKSQEEIERQERCGRGDAWSLAKYLQAQREKQNHILCADQRVEFAGRIHNKTGGKELVVGSGASVHVVSRKNNNFAELDTMKVFEHRTTVVTANDEVLA